MDAAPYKLSIDPGEKKNMIKEQGLEPILDELIQEIKYLKGNR